MDDLKSTTIFARLDRTRNKTDFEHETEVEFMCVKNRDRRGPIETIAKVKHLQPL